MILIKSDHDRRIDITGVPDPVRRPVDIGPSVTGFSNLRTLRIYQFEKDSVIEGHAEQDEVFIVVLAGAIELTMIVDPSENALSPIVLTAPDGSGARLACAAYLPAHAAYKLIPQSEADVAYARATPTTPSTCPPPRSFSPPVRPAGSYVWLEETAYAERLRFRLMLFGKQDSTVSSIPVKVSEAMCEALVYVRSVPPNGVSVTAARDTAPVCLESWDTVALAAGENPTFTIGVESAALVLVVAAA